MRISDWSPDVCSSDLGYGRDNLAAIVMALLVDPKFGYPNDETGKAALIAAITAKLDDMRRRLPRFFPELPGAQVQIRRVPAFLESGAPFARYEDPSIDEIGRAHV